MALQLSQDLPEETQVDTLDILGGDETSESGALGIIPEDTEEVVEETETKKVEEEANAEAEKEEAPETDTEIPTLDNALGDTKEIKEEIDKSIDETEEIKETIEEAKEAISDDDTDTAEKLIDDLYQQVIDYSTRVDTLSTKNDILSSKLEELNTSNAGYELQIAQNVTNSTDPKMIILNRMYDGAASGEEFAKGKVITTLEDMYYKLTGKSFEEKRIDGVSDKNAGDVVLNELTAPEVEEDIQEEVDVNDITSIF